MTNTDNASGAGMRLQQRLKNARLLGGFDPDEVHSLTVNTADLETVLAASRLLAEKEGEIATLKALIAAIVENRADCYIPTQCCPESLLHWGERAVAALKPRRKHHEPVLRMQVPSDSDQGFCLGCGRWINYRENK